MNAWGGGSGKEGGGAGGRISQGRFDTAGGSPPHPRQTFRSHILFDASRGSAQRGSHSQAVPHRCARGGCDRDSGLKLASICSNWESEIRHRPTPPARGFQP